MLIIKKAVLNHNKSKIEDGLTEEELLFSKMSAGFIAFLLFFIFYMVVNYVLYGCFFGFKDLQMPVIVYDFNLNKIVEYNAIVYAFINFLATLPMYLILFTLAFLMGVVFENAIIAIIVPLIVYMFGNVISMLIPASLDRLKALLPTNCWTLNAFLNGGLSSLKYATLTKSIIVDVVFIVLFIALSIIFFKKKDIKNQ